jgi:hypothetical protein
MTPLAISISIIVHYIGISIALYSINQDPVFGVCGVNYLMVS